MAEAAEKLSGKLGLDTTDFKTGVQAANRELRVLESGFRAGVAALGDWSASSTGLEARVKSLTSQMDIQRLKVAAVREEYERVKTEKGENSRAAQDLEIKLNKETETLGKMESELGTTEAALTEMSTATEESGEKAEEASQKHITFGDALRGVGVVAKGVVTAVIGLVAAVAAVGAAIGGLVFSSANAAGELVDLSAKTGISATALQEMRFVGEQVGVSLETIATSQARLTRSMASAAEGTGDAAKAFDELGVSVTNSDGSLRDQQEVMADVLTALSGIDNAAERDALAMQIFGRSAMELNPLIGVTADELVRMKDNAHKLGAVMSEEDIAALEAFDDTMGALKLGLQGTLGTLSTLFLPGFQMVFDEIGGYLERFAGIVKNFGGTDNLIPGLTSLFADIAKDIAKSAPAMLKAGLSLIMGIISAVKSALPSLLTSATDIINALVEFLITALPVLLPMGIDILLTLVNAILSNLPMLIEAALQAIIALATGLSAALPTLIPAVVEALITIVDTLIDNAPMLIEAALQLILGLSQGLIAAIPILIPAIPQIIVAIVDTLADSAPSLISALVTTISSLYNAVGPEAMVDIILLMVKAIFDNLPLLLVAGANLLLGISQGLANAVPETTKQAITDFLTQLAFELIAQRDALIESGRELINSLKMGLVSNLIALVGFGSELAITLQLAIKNASKSISKAGAAIVEGLWAGITGQSGWLYQKIKQWIDDLIQKFLDAEDAKSPAKRFMPAGKFAVQGFVGGMFAEAAKLDGQMNALMSGVHFNPAFAAAGGASSNVSNTTNNYGNTVNGLTIPGDPRTLTLADVMDFLNKRG